ncbi:MAG TPA: PilZ domain-containing protein [Stellaceae bacterium]|nr:PilZ domain-containing protein [Stellaceae bacterium]
MRIARTNFDRHEQRRDRRYALPPLTVIIDQQDYVSDNWSLGGFHLTCALPLKVGEVVAGTLHVDGSDGFAFTASVVRKDLEAGTLAFHFQEMTPLAVTRLDRALARRLVPRHRP